MYTEHCVANLSSNLGEKSEECMCCMMHNISRMCSGGKEESENLLTLHIHHQFPALSS